MNPGGETVKWRIHRAETLLEPGAGNGSKAKWQMKKVLNSIEKRQDRKNTYRYKDIPYNEAIRVLKLYPGARGSPLISSLVPQALYDTASLRRLELTHSDRYDALSYFWGDGDPEHSLHIFKDNEGYSDWKEKGLKDHLLPLFVGQLLIRGNLKDALEQLRDPREAVLLWVDAVCINQKNDKERSAQVARMHDVYAQANKVHIWLGKPQNAIQNEKAFSFLYQILDLKNLEDVVKRLERKSEAEAWEEDRESVRATIDLMKAKWFSRRWVIQELALATHAYVRRGKEEMSWSDFADAIALFMTKYDHIRRLAFRSLTEYGTSRSAVGTEDHNISSLDARALGAYSLVSVTSELFRKSREGMVVQRLLSLEVLVSSMLLAFEATDPKDTVFAVLQIAKDIQDNKSQSVPPQQWGWKFQILPVIPIYALMLGEFAMLPNTTTEISAERGTKSSIVIVLESCRVLLSVLAILLIWRSFLDLLSNCASLVINRRLNTRPIFDKRIEANYRKCLNDVCADFIEYCIEKSNSLDILCRHWAPESKHMHGDATSTPHESMPSWILRITGDAFGGPTQTLKGRVNGDSFVKGTERGSPYSASGGSIPMYRFGKTKEYIDNIEDDMVEDPDPEGYTKIPESAKKEYPARFDGSLRVKGFQLGSIDKTAPIAGPVITRAALELCGWRRGAGKELSDQVWRILVANRGPNGTNPPSWYRRACISSLDWYENQAEDTFNTNTLKNYSGTPEGKVAFLDRVQQVVFGRTVIRIADTNDPSTLYVGIAPQESQKSYIVCILYGCSVPVVLEPLGRSVYKFIGECYVHGFMDGEALDPETRGQRSKDEWFGLR